MLNRVQEPPRRRRWSDNDYYFGPFTYARSQSYRAFAMVIDSGDDDESVGCCLRLNAFGFTLITALPAIIKPWREKVVAKSWDAATIERLGRNWYLNTQSRCYGFSYSEGFLQVFLGRQTGDSSTTQDWCRHLPWTQWRHVRHSLYGLRGEHRWTGLNCTGRGGYEILRKAQDSCPTRTFSFVDFDGEHLTARTRIEESEWRLGTGRFKWLSLFRAPKVRRSLDIQFSGETGRRKGSWKGGTIGHGTEMQRGETHEVAFRRYCAEHGMRFLGETSAGSSA